MKRLYLLLIVFAFAKTITAQQEIIDISTGYTNGIPINYGLYDDTWLVKKVGGAFYQPRVVSADAGWGNSGCSMWISPQTTANNGILVAQDSGNYTYETTFMICHRTTSASIEFTSIGADNEFLELRFNNFVYAFNFAGTDDHNPLIQNHTITLNPAHVNVGTNRLTIVVRNRLSILGGNQMTASGMTVCGRVVANTIINAGSNQTICAGSCTTIGTAAQPGIQYTWTNSAGTVIGNTAQVTVCPTAALSIYTLTATNTQLGCSISDAVKVITVTNDPSFTVDNFCTVGPATFNLRAKPVVTNANQVTGFGEMYYIERLSAPYHNTASGSNPNPSCWWVYPNNVYFLGYNNAQNVTCNSTIGFFANNAVYRITRGTWNAYCPWRQFSVVVYGCMAALPREKTDSLQLDEQAPDLSYLKPAQTDDKGLIYPNPSNGRFTVKTQGIQQGTVEVYSPSGVLLQRTTVTNLKANTIIDLSGYDNGTYLVKVIAGNKVTTNKLLLVR